MAAVEPERPVRAEAPPRLVAVVDEPRIRQVLANLLGNVRAHTPVTTPVAVRLGALTGGVLLEVADAGPGMSREDAARAFDRFHRAPDQVNGDADYGNGTHGNGTHGGEPARGQAGERRESNGGGSGLGLSIVQAIARAHGGTLTVSSSPEAGTAFTLSLPRGGSQS